MVSQYHMHKHLNNAHFPKVFWFLLVWQRYLWSAAGLVVGQVCDTSLLQIRFLFSTSYHCLSPHVISFMGCAFSLGCNILGTDFALAFCVQCLAQWVCYSRSPGYLCPPSPKSLNWSASFGYSVFPRDISVWPTAWMSNTTVKFIFKTTEVMLWVGLVAFPDVCWCNISYCASVLKDALLTSACFTFT